MKKVLAVSGGADSMVMLDIACRRFDGDEIVVAHFDHGIRENSDEDARFVERKATEYGAEFRLGKATLGAGASEAEAREERYKFLMRVASEAGGELWTAHHLDDLAETITINFLRGTGWRGLAVLDRDGVKRPFLETELFYEPMDRAAILEYAAKRKLVYRDDPSNSWDEYLRNRVREKMNNLLDFEQKMAIFDLWQKQKRTRSEVDGILNGMLPEDGRYERAWFREMDADELAQKVALEILRAATLRAGVGAMRPQLEDFRQAILNYGTGKRFNLPGDKLVKLGREEFWL